MAGHDTPPLTDNQIHDAFTHPIGTRTISELSHGKRGKIVITVDDLTRPTPAYRVLPFILKELKASGITDDQILIIGAIGTHHPMNLHDFTLKVGPEIIAKYDVVNHNPFEHFTELARARDQVKPSFPASRPLTPSLGTTMLSHTPITMKQPTIRGRSKAISPGRICRKPRGLLESM